MEPTKLIGTYIFGPRLLIIALFPINIGNLSNIPFLPPLIFWVLPTFPFSKSFILSSNSLVTKSNTLYDLSIS